jgi:hypothetical protein
MSLTNGNRTIIYKNQQGEKEILRCVMVNGFASYQKKIRITVTPVRTHSLADYISQLAELEEGMIEATIRIIPSDQVEDDSIIEVEGWVEGVPSHDIALALVQEEKRRKAILVQAKEWAAAQMSTFRNI